MLQGVIQFLIKYIEKKPCLALVSFMTLMSSATDPKWGAFLSPLYSLLVSRCLVWLWKNSSPEYCFSEGGTKVAFFLEANVREGTSLHPAAAESSCVQYWSNKHALWKRNAALGLFHISKFKFFCSIKQDGLSEYSGRNSSLPFAVYVVS